jgi:tripartite-type tricarboxylate transporter receptor subunit TctC
MTRIAAVVTSALLTAVASSAAAQSAGDAKDFPNRPMRIVVGFAPGGTTDILSRLLGAHLPQSWGQQVVVDNRTGASGVIATEIVAKSQPDGYTLYVTPSGTHTSNLSLYRKLPYDTVKDLAPVSQFAWVSNLIVTHPSSPIRTLDDIVKMAKAKPDQVTYATSSAGTIAHLSAELLNILTGIRTVHVPYKGGAPALAAIASNEVNIMFAALPSATPFVQAKRLRPIAQTSPKRWPTLPDVPTVAEAGLPGLQVMEWYGALAPARTPTAVIEKINAEINRIVRKPDVQARFAELGIEAVTISPEEFGKQVVTDIATWAKVVKQAGIRLD